VTANKINLSPLKTSILSQRLTLRAWEHFAGWTCPTGIFFVRFEERRPRSELDRVPDALDLGGTPTMTLG
jgi:hypothetical protein